MATPPEKDFSKLIAELKSGPKRKPPAVLKARAARPYFIALMGLGTIFVMGLLYLVFASFLTEVHEEAPRTEGPQPHPAERDLSPVTVPIAAAAPSAGSTEMPPPVGARPRQTGLRPGNYLADMAARGQLPQWVPLSSLQLPTNGKPLIVYCLLYAQLDAYTEQLWKQAGLLREDNPVPDPFLRKVRIDAVIDISYLIDWHVESVALSIPLPKPEEPEIPFP